MIPGYQTTEFYVSLLTPLLAIAATLGLHIANADALVQAIALLAATIASAIGGAVYTHQRTTLKVATVTQLVPSAPTSVPPIPTTKPIL